MDINFEKIRAIDFFTERFPKEFEVHGRTKGKANLGIRYSMSIDLRPPWNDIPLQAIEIIRSNTDDVGYFTWIANEMALQAAQRLHVSAVELDAGIQAKKTLCMIRDMLIHFNDISIGLDTNSRKEINKMLGILISIVGLGHD